MSEVQAKRLEAFKALLDRYGVEASIYDTECEFLPKFDDIERAVARAVEYVTDDMFVELPAAVVDLDTGEVRVPDWSKLHWKRV